MTINFRLSKLKQARPPKLLTIAFAIVLIASLGLRMWRSTHPIGECCSSGPTFDIAPNASFVPNAFMPTLISVVLLAAALWVILSQRYTPTDRHWAYGALGTVVGFWLHG